MAACQSRREATSEELCVLMRSERLAAGVGSEVLLVSLLYCTLAVSFLSSSYILSLSLSLSLSFSVLCCLITSGSGARLVTEL